MENKELETWLKETKAKNLSKEKLKEVTNNLDSVFYNKLRKELKVVGTLSEHLFNQWQKESEFSPKIIGYKAPFDMYSGKQIVKGDIFVVCHTDTYSCKGYVFPSEIVETWEPEFEPLPTETDFKTQVIELIKSLIDESNEKMEAALKAKSYQDVLAWKIANQERGQLLKQIKQLC